MNIDKALLTIEKLIKLTKSSKIEWYPISGLSKYKGTFFSSYNDTLSFYCNPKKDMNILLLTRDAINDIEMYIDVKGFPISLLCKKGIDFNDEEYIKFLAQVKRLYNIVYDVIPSIEKCIDEFLNLPD